MAENLVGAAADVAADRTCGICLEEPSDPLDLPCGHSFCEGCLGEWRSRYGVEEEMRRKCPICRASLPPSREMVTFLLSLRAEKQELEDNYDTSSEHYHRVCRCLKEAEERIGADWDGVTVLQDNNDRQAVVMPEYVFTAISGGEIKPVLRWIYANQTEDRVNAITSVERMCMPALAIACMGDHLELMVLLLQLGAYVDTRVNNGGTAMSIMFSALGRRGMDVNERVRLLLSWGASFFPDSRARSRDDCISIARRGGKPELANLLESELGGRRCEIVDLSSRSDINGTTCVADEYLPDGNRYKVTLETKSKEVMVLSPDNLKRRDRTQQDCGYYIEFKNGRTIRHDFDSSEDCQAFVAALNNEDETRPAVTEEAEARAEQAAAELLAELGLDESPNESSSSGCKAKKSKKKKGGKKKKKN